MNKFKRLSIEIPFKILAILTSILLLGVSAILGLNSVSFAQTSNDWVTSRDTANPPNLNFYLYGNGASGANLQLNPSGDTRVRSLIDLNNSTYKLDPDGQSILKNVSISSGNLGIGTTTPQVPLEVNGIAILGSSTQGGLRIQTVDSNSVALRPSIGNGDITISDDSALPTRGIIIENGGNLGVKISDPIQTLDVNGDALVRGALIMMVSGVEQTVIDAGGGWHRTHGATGWRNETYQGGWYMTDVTWVRSFNDKSVYTGGIMRADSGFQGPSDIRFKENVKPISSPLAKIEALNGVRFNFKQDIPDKNFPKEDQIGLIAQDVKKVLPEIVYTDNNGSQYLYVDYTKLTPVIVEAIKEQQGKIESLENLLNEQKRINDSQQEEIDTLKLMLGQIEDEK